MSAKVLFVLVIVEACRLDYVGTLHLSLIATTRASARTVNSPLHAILVVLCIIVIVTIACVVRAELLCLVVLALLVFAATRTTRAI